jgi:hypothetical protein
MNTLTTTQTRPAHRASYRLVTFVVGICILALPATAGAFYGTASDDGNGSAGDTIARNAGLVAPDHTALNESLGPVSGSPSPGGIQEPPATPVSSPSATADGFDWADAALGAGVVMAAVTLGGLALVTLRRRTAVSPSA